MSTIVTATDFATVRPDFIVVIPTRQCSVLYTPVTAQTPVVSRRAKKAKKICILFPLYP
jgi:hypothetical protein